MINSGSKVKCIKFQGVTEKLKADAVYTVRYVEFNPATQGYWLHLELTEGASLDAMPMDFFEEV